MTLMRIRGEDVQQGLRDWIKADLKDSPRMGTDLGKFFFSVSAGTIGALTTIQKVNTASAGLPTALTGSIVTLFVSIWVALVMVLPKKRRFSGESELQEEYTKAIDAVVMLAWVWFMLWFSGTVVGLVSVVR
jgi:hypothetical protein